MNDSYLRIEPRSSGRRPTCLKRPDGGASSELGIEADALKAWDAGEHLAADAARSEETKRAITFCFRICDTKRRDSPGGANEWLRRPCLRNASVITSLGKAPERTGRSGTRHCCVNGARYLESIAPICRFFPWLGPEVIAQMAAQILPDNAPRRQLVGVRLRQE